MRKKQTNKQPIPYLPKNLLELKQLLKIVSLIQHYDATLTASSCCAALNRASLLWYNLQITLRLEEAAHVGYEMQP